MSKMFQKYHFYHRIFHPNKLGSRTLFSSWQNSAKIFGNKFMQIQNGNANSNCNILTQPQQRYQFCSANALPGTLDTQFLWLDTDKRNYVKFQFQKGKSGHNCIKIISNNLGNFFHFPNILVPQDAYAFVRALDELIEELATENFEQKLEIQDPKLSIKIVKNHRKKYKMRITKMKIVEVPGIIHKFQLELFLKNKNKSEKEICLGLIAFNETTKQKRVTNLPLQALPWLRKQMVEMLVRHDGTKAILCDAPAQIPQQFFLKDAFPAPSAIQKLDQKETMTQNINKKSSFVQQYPTIQNYNNKSGDKKQTMPVHFDTQQKDVFHAPLVQDINHCHNLDGFANKKPASFQHYPKMASKTKNCSHLCQSIKDQI